MYPCRKLGIRLGLNGLPGSLWEGLVLSCLLVVPWSNCMAGSWVLKTDQGSQQGPPVSRVCCQARVLPVWRARRPQAADRLVSGSAGGAPPQPSRP